MENLNKPDTQYINLVRRVLAEGDRKSTQGKERSANIAIHGTQMRFDLRNGYTVPTERKINPMHAIKELLWMCSGSTDIKDLQAMGVQFWNKWGASDITSKFGREEGDLGPLYGYQWRNFSGKVDQIQLTLDGLRRDPDGKQHRITSWNPADFCNADGTFNVRPLTCHGDVQFSHANGYLDLEMTQRSGDLLIGVPFNMAFYGAMLHLYAHVLGMQPRYFTHTINDCHIYCDQLEVTDHEGTKLIDILLAREPRPFPNLRINPDLTDFFKAKPGDFVIEGYDPHPVIKFPVAL